MSPPGRPKGEFLSAQREGSPVSPPVRPEGESPPASAQTVYIVDDEADLRRALMRLLMADGLTVESFGSAAAFLAQVPAGACGCLVLDVSMPGLDGLQLQEQLKHRAAMLPIVFLTGQGDIPTSVRAIKAGAVDFLTKPVKGADLLRAVHAGLADAQKNQAAAGALAQLQQRAARLTVREREVMQHVIAGRLNKVIADRLGTSEQTIKVHRGRLMEKLEVDSVADLVRVAQQLDIGPAA
jgi:FixJ family two-component response regulator